MYLFAREGERVEQTKSFSYPTPFVWQVFRYNANEDRLEICLEPHGHYPIEPGIEELITRTGMLQSQIEQMAPPDVTQSLSTGGSGVVVNKSMVFPKGKTAAFSGQGHSLLSSNMNENMPQELEPAHHRQKAMNFQELRRSSLTESIEEETEVIGSSVAMETDNNKRTGAEGGVGGKGPVYRKIGPAYTVLDEEADEEIRNDIRNTSQLFQNLASEIQTIADAPMSHLGDPVSGVKESKPTTEVMEVGETD